MGRQVCLTVPSQTNGDNSPAEGGLADRCAPPGYQKKNPLRFGILNEQAKLSQRFMRWETTVDGRQQDAVSESQWNKMLVFKQNPSMQTPTCIKLINNYFFRAIQYLNKEIIYKKRMGKANPFNKNFEKMTQELYEYALKNDDTIIRDRLDKHSSYIREKRTQILKNIEKKTAEEEAKKKAAEGEAATKKKTNPENEVVPTLFDYQYYRANNPDVVDMIGSTKEALIAHYKEFGWKEGRKRYQGDIPWQIRQQADWAKHIRTFDWKYYGANNPDVVDIIGSTKEALIAHYTAYGFAEGRSPNKENTNTDNSLLDTLYITKYNLDDEINNLSENAIKVYVEYHKATRNGFQDKAEFDEAAKKKAADEKAANDKFSKVINLADFAGDNTATDKLLQSLVHYGKEASALMKAAEKEAPAKNTKVVDSYILTSKSLMKMYEKGNKEHYKLKGNINAVEIKQFKGTQIKTITLDGQSKTISCGDTCTLYSAKKVSLQIGSDLGIPAYIHKAIMDAIVEAMGEEFAKNLSETELRKFQVAMRKLIVPHWKSLEDVVAKVMGDPNFNIASFMTKEQIEQIKTIQRQIRKSSQKNKGSGQESSGGSAADGATAGGSVEGHDHHHEEEDPGPAPAMSSGSMAYP